MKKEYHPNESDLRHIYQFLEGEITSRQLGDALDISHQGAINAVSSMCRTMVQNKELTFTNKFFEKAWPNDSGMRIAENPSGSLLTPLTNKQ